MRLPRVMIVLVLSIAAPARAAPPSEWAVSAGAGASMAAPSFSVNAELAARWRCWGVVAKLDWNSWIATQDPESFKAGALNLGLGAEYRYFEGRARSAVVAGPSMLLFRTQLDEPGTVGFFVELAPVGLRWELAKRWHLRWDPLSLHLVAPVLDEIPLVVIEYRSSVAIEWSLP